MKRSALATLAGLMVSVCCSGSAEVGARPISYKPPNETAALMPGPNLEIVQNNCTTCHSTDYIHTNLGARNSSKTSGVPRSPK